MSNDDMAEQPATPTPERTRRPSWLGKTAVAVLGVLAIVGLLASTLAVWTRTTLADTDRFVAIAEDVIADPQVQLALSTRLAEETIVALAVDERIEGLLPPALAPVTGVVVASVQTAVQRTYELVLRTEATQRVVGVAVRRAHTAFMAALRGEALPEGVYIDDDTVTLNMIPVVVLVLQALQDRFGIFADIDIPEAGDGSPTDQIAELGEAFGRELPATFGQVAVYSGERVADADAFVDAARAFAVRVDRWLWALGIVTAALFVATVWFSDRRWRSVLILGVGSAATVLVAREMISQILQRIPEAVAASGARATVQIAADDLAEGLQNFTSVLLLVSILVAGGAWWAQRRDRPSS